jgi:hypothetical protein
MINTVVQAFAFLHQYFTRWDAQAGQHIKQCLPFYG